MSQLHKHTSSVNPVRLSYLRPDAPEPQRHPSVDAAQRRPRSPDEFCLVFDWKLSAESLIFHAESLISWAPVEMVAVPERVSDETGKTWFVCRFRYFGPVVEREQLVGSVKNALLDLAPWQEVQCIAFSDEADR